MWNREGRPSKLKIGLKYCGGCRAQYDRVKTVEEIKKHVGDAIRFVSPDDRETDMIMVVTGCKTACADISAFSDRPIVFIKGKEDADRFVDEVKKYGKKLKE